MHISAAFRQFAAAASAGAERWDEAERALADWESALPPDMVESSRAVSRISTEDYGGLSAGRSRSFELDRRAKQRSTLLAVVALPSFPC
jgi:hypothetical protein